MKKLFTTALLTASLACGLAQAETYTLSNDGANNSPMHNQGFDAVTWNATLTANATGNSYLNGTFVGSDHKTYSINMTFVDTYFNAGKQYWGNFWGKITGNGRNISLNDLQPTRNQYDAVLGINATPYNDLKPGGNTQVMEFGFWGDDSPAAGGTRNSDVNVHVRCTSGTGAAGPSNANGTCTTAGKVPLPGSLALMGIAMIGMGAMRKIRRA